MLPLPATATTKRPTELKFEDPTGTAWLLKLSRFKRRLLNASTPTNSLPNVGSTPNSSVAGGKDHQRNLDEINADDGDADNGETSRTVVGDENVTEEGRNGGEGSEHATSAVTGQSRTGGIDNASECDEDLRFSSDWFLITKGHLLHFYAPKFPDEESEAQFQKERWYNTKPLSIGASIFLVANWVLYLIFNHSISLFEKVAYYGVATFFTLPLPIFIAFNFPTRYPLFYQIWLMISTWQWGIAENIETKVCRFFTPPKECGHKDFLFMMVYAIALPALVLFSCHQKRIFATIGATVQFILLATLILPVQQIFVRNVISFLAFAGFFIYLHHYQEQIDRRMFILRAQIKIAYKAQGKAQLAQKQAASSKRRFVSYIFHEVRVPLNSAMLAFQNMQSNNAFKHCEKEQSVEIDALEGSMAAMKQVLDDVLDLQRMDSGAFENDPRPFPFTRTIQSMLGAVKVGAAAKGLELNIELDERIDNVFNGSGVQSSSEELWVYGDPLRLRQVLSNFTSNAVKFTPAKSGGSISVKTTLIRPSVSPKTSTKSAQPGHIEADVMATSLHPLRPAIDHRQSTFETLREATRGRGVGGGSIQDHDKSITVRIAVSDTGHGISSAESRHLFEPFVQTRLGSSQAGKGSGLGLAIVRQIVSLSGGRLGFSSRKNVGSTFWVEFTYSLPTNKQIQEQKDSTAGASVATPSPSGSPRSEIPPPHHMYLGESVEPLESRRVTTFSQHLHSSPRPMAQINFAPMFTAGKTYNPYFDRIPPQPDVILDQETIASSSHPPLIKAHTSPSPLPTPPETHISEFEGVPSALSKRDSITKPKAGSKAEQPSDAESHKLSVLIVDDDPLTRKLLSRMLTRLSCTVSTANDGQELLDMLLTDPPTYFDLVSLDNAMPVMTGQEAVKRLRENGRKDFVVGATGNALKGDQAAYLDAGADLVLSKPVTIKDFKAVLQVAYERRSAVR